MTKRLGKSPESFLPLTPVAFEILLVNTWDPSTALTPITLIVNWPQSLNK